MGSHQRSLIGVCAECGEAATWAHPAGRFCNDVCRANHYDRSHPRIALAEGPDKETRAQKILRRLRQGPASGLDLLKAGGGTRYGARIHNLRELGYRIETDMPRDTGLEWPMYRLEEL